MSAANGGGDDNRYGDDEVTANDLPGPTLDEHRPYVSALAAVIAPLNATVLMLGDVLHEFRIAREPASKLLIGQIAQAGRVLEGVGRSLAEGFSK